MAESGVFCLPGTLIFHRGQTVEPCGGIQIADRVEFPAEARRDLSGAVCIRRREAVCQHFLQRGRVGISQRPTVRPDVGRGLRAAEIAVRCGGDGLQCVELCLDAVVLGLQRCDGLGEIRRLPGADLQTVLGQQKAVLRVGDAGILGSVQLIQQVVQRLLRLVCQHRKLTAGQNSATS